MLLPYGHRGGATVKCEGGRGGRQPAPPQLIFRGAKDDLIRQSQLDTHLRIPSRLDHDVASAAIRDAQADTDSPEPERARIRGSRPTSARITVRKRVAVRAAELGKVPRSPEASRGRDLTTR